MGVLLPNDLKILLTENGFLPTKKTIYEIIAEFDQEETGGISFSEFMKAMVAKPFEKEKKKVYNRFLFHVFKTLFGVEPEPRSSFGFHSPAAL